VIISRDDIRPVEVANPHLFESKPQAASSLPETRGATTDSAVTDVPAAHPPITPNTDAQQVTDLQGRSTRAVDDVVPTSIFVSRKLGKLFVRRGFTPLFDIPVRIKDPEESLGTHVFTVMASQNEGARFRWMVVSMPEKSPQAPLAAKRRPPGKHMEEIAPAAASPDKANAALDRIEIPQDLVARISQLLTAGSSLILSDYGPSNETRNDTDFIVEMH
jgi:hypothetical protein